MIKKYFSHEEASAFYYRTKDKFSLTLEWRHLRRCALLIYGNECHCCYREGTKYKPLHVDHIKPKSLFPYLCMDITNLQVLCEECNTLKSNKTFEDYRPEQHKHNANLFKQDRSHLKQILTERATKSVLLTGKKKKLATEKPVKRVFEKKTQSKQECKQHKTEKKKKHQQFLTLQVSFLTEMKEAVKQGKQFDVYEKYLSTLGKGATNSLVSLCKINHWFKR